MKRVMLFLIFLLYISCKENYENFDNFSDLIQGDWLKLHPIRTVGDSVVIPSPMNIEIGFGFSHNGIMEHKTGFFKNEPLRIVGFETTYRIVKDSLFYLNPDSGRYSVLKIDLLTQDSLVMGGVAYQKLHLIPKGEEFDALLFKNGHMEIYINEDGTSKISGVNMDKYKNVNKEFIREEFKDIRNAFMKAGYQKLNDEYTGSFHCDDCMESNIKVSFFKRGKIIKTIQDAGQGSPMPFLWACLKMQYLPFIYKLSFEKT